MFTSDAVLVAPTYQAGAMKCFLGSPVAVTGICNAPHATNVFVFLATKEEMHDAYAKLLL